MGRFLLILVCAAAAFQIFGTRDVDAGDPRLKTGTDGVVMLSAEWCGYCDALRADLKRSGAKFRELDVENDAEGVAAWDAFGANGVPITIVGQRVVHGYDPDTIKRLMTVAGHRLAKN